MLNVTARDRRNVQIRRVDNVGKSLNTKACIKTVFAADRCLNTIMIYCHVAVEFRLHTREIIFYSYPHDFSGKLHAHVIV